MTTMICKFISLRVIKCVLVLLSTSTTITTKVKAIRPNQAFVSSTSNTNTNKRTSLRPLFPSKNRKIHDNVYIYQPLPSSSSSSSSSSLCNKFLKDDNTDNDEHYSSSSVNLNNSKSTDNTRRQLLLSMLVSTGVSTSIISSAAFANAADDNALLTELVTVTEPPSIASSVRSDGNNKLIVPPMDKRQYETFTLENGLRVILCSDPTSFSAAAAMDVHVGAAADPDAVPGLAHFCEHMLFLGTKKYPQEDSFETFLSSNGGSSNAFTDSEDTVYYFDMTADKNLKLEEGLDRFGSFFTSPLFTEGATGRELNAIESENSKNLQSDTFRSYQMEKSRANNQHPYSKFYTGNKSTLLDMTKKNNIDLRTELIKFWSTYYSANQMSLALVAPQPLHVLKSMVEKSFGSIQNNIDRSLIKPEEAWVGKVNPFTLAPRGNSIIPAQKHIVEIVPVADIRSVTLTFPIVFTSLEDKEDQFLNKPAFYISHLLGHEGPNSLLSYLKKKGWVNGLSAGMEADLSDFYTFEVACQLTSKGLNAMDEIVETIFSYIRMLKEDNIPKYVFDEVLQLNELEWRFLTKGAAGPYVQSLVKGMQDYPQNLYIAGPRRMALRYSDSKLLSSAKPRSKFEMDKQYEDTVQSTAKLVSKLSVDNAMVTVMSKTFDGRTNKSEKWYGTKYSVKPLSASTLNQWTNSPRAYNFGMSYPRPNPFIPSEEGLRVKKPVKDAEKMEVVSFEERMKPITPPEIIRDDGDEGRWTVYYKQDDRFGQPKAVAIFQLLTKEVYDSPISACLSKLYQVAANDRLVEYTYDANLAGLSFSVEVLPRGIRLLFSGYNDKLLDFATYVSAKLSQDFTSVLPDNQDEFERYKDELVRAFAAFDVQQVYSHAVYYSNLAFNPKNFQYTNSELRDAIQKVTLDDLTNYVKDLWKSGKAEGLLQGNIEKSEALQFVDVIDRTIAFKPISSSDLPARYEALSLPQNSNPTKIIVAEPNPDNKNAATQVSYQCLDTTEKAHVIAEIVGTILSERFYEDLRTRQQLGYIVSSGIKAVAETRILSFIVQSSVKPADQLTAATLKFVENARKNYFEPLTDDDIDVYAKGSLLRRTEPDKKLATEVTRNWNEIATGRLQFDRRQAESKALLEVTKEDVIKFWDDVVIGVSGEKRMLVTEVVPKNGAASSKTPSRSSAKPLQLGIDDINQFRIDRELAKK